MSSAAAVFALARRTSPAFITNLLELTYSKEEPAGTGAFRNKYVGSPVPLKRYRSTVALVAVLLEVIIPIIIKVLAPVAVKILVAESDATAAVDKLDFVARLKVFAMSA
jgi:hypothetical protein